VADEAAVFCEPLAAALQVPQLLHLRPADRVLVVGAGRLGQLIARVLRLAGVELAVVARHAHQRTRLAQAGISAIAEDAVAPSGYDHVVEATGAAGGFELARQAVRPRGTLCLKSTFRGRTPVDLASLVVDEIHLVGSRCGPFPAALRLLEQGLVDPTPLIDLRLPLRRGIEGVARAGESGILKVLFDCALPSDAG
ncbi:MAG: alcohol dehydrogenase, partial [Planctomycetes bacterium]|nr:alcohol dehydrogenase [Planctomycetota bacterium]